MHVQIGNSDSWNVEVKMSIRPSSSTGVLFALVHKDTVPLSVAVVTLGEEDAVSTFKLLNTFVVPACQRLKQTNKKRSALQSVPLPSAEPASVSGRRLCGKTGHAHALLSRSADSAAECDSHGHSDNSQFLHCHVHRIGCPAEGFGGPQHNNAERCADIYWWNTRLVQIPSKSFVGKL